MKKELAEVITHVVCFKLKDRSPENVKKTKDVLLGMQGKIPQVKQLEVGSDVLHSDRSYDIVLISKHDTMADLDGYQVHPVHQEVIVYMKTVVDVSVSVDYES
jgi:hypothetical protein